MIASMEGSSFHPLLRGAARLISLIFHPLFVPVYVGWFFIYVERLFPEQDAWHRTLLLITFFVNYTLMPLVTLLLARGLGFIQSLYLKNQRDRIIPYIATGIFYFWVWYVFKNQNYPDHLVMFGLAVFIASSAGLIANIYLKISMHTLAMGVVATLFFILAFSSLLYYGVYLSVVLLIAGLVGTARLLTSDHNTAEVFAGYILGAFCQVLAWAITV